MMYVPLHAPPNEALLIEPATSPNGAPLISLPHSIPYSSCYAALGDFDLSVVNLSNTIDSALFPATLHMVINGSNNMYIAVTIASISEDSPK